MIFVKDSEDERTFLDSDVVSAVGTFNALRVKPGVNFVSITWLKDNGT